MPGFALGAGDTLFAHPTAGFAQGNTVPAHPLEELFDDARFLEYHLVLCLPPGGMLAEVTIAIRGCAQHIDRSSPGCVPLAPATALHDLRPFVLGDHPLHLQR